MTPVTAGQALCGSDEEDGVSCGSGVATGLLSPNGEARFLSTLRSMDSPQVPPYLAPRQAFGHSQRQLRNRSPETSPRWLPSSPLLEWTGP